MVLSAEHISCGYGGRAIVHDVSFTAEAGEVVCLLGPNGAGKTTFFRTMQGFIPPVSGSIRVNGESFSHYNRRELAKLLAYVPQSQGQPFDYSVFDMVLMGRASYVRNFSAPSSKDREICESIIHHLSLDYLRNRLYTQISGGERQMVLIARAMAQEPQFLMMDEPTSSLDFGNQVRVLRQIRRLSEEGIGILMITHSPDQALLCADKVVLFRKYRSVIVGVPSEILTEDVLQDAYGVQVRFAEANDSRGSVTRACVPVMEDLPVNEKPL